jgi:alpha-L-rhamnosidase
MALVKNVHFEHYRPDYDLGVDERTPRISWTYDCSEPVKQQSYNIEVSEILATGKSKVSHCAKVVSESSQLEPWPLETPLQSKQRVSLRIQGVSDKGEVTPWSEPSVLETGLLNTSDWIAKRITGSQTRDPTKSHPEQLFRKVFSIDQSIVSARLYITSQGVYESEINGVRVGDYFLAPGFTEYSDRLQYQTYDVSKLLRDGKNCIGVRVAEGWFNDGLDSKEGSATSGVTGTRSSRNSKLLSTTAVCNKLYPTRAGVSQKDLPN